MNEKDKYTLPQDKSSEDVETFDAFDPLALMTTVARCEALASVGDNLLNAGQTLYSPNDTNPEKLKQTRPDGSSEEGTYFDGKFHPNL